MIRFRMFVEEQTWGADRVTTGYIPGIELRLAIGGNTDVWKGARQDTHKEAVLAAQARYQMLIREAIQFYPDDVDDRVRQFEPTIA